MASITTAFFNKVARGSVSLHLDDVNGIMPSRWFRMEHNRERIAVPINYALSVFTNNDLAAMLKEKYFEIENIEEFLKVAQEQGYVAYTPEEEKEIKAPAKTDAMLLMIMQGGNQVKIKELFESTDKERALSLARDNHDKLSIGVATLIEEVTGMAVLEDVE